jgi:hypothetical protein
MLLFEALGFFIVWQSALLSIVKVAFTVVLFWGLYSICRYPKPQSKYLQLSYREGFWWLIDVEGLEQKYQKGEVTFRAGLFFLLTLKSDSSKLTLVVFNDQITKAQFRFIKYISFRAR